MSDLLIELVRRYSPSTHETPAVVYLVEWLNAHGAAARIDAAGNAVGVRGEADADHLLLLLGHIDTVPGEIPVRVEDGTLYGRGSVDAKGSLCAFADALAQAAIPAGWRVMVVGAVEEEIDTSKGAHFIREQMTPDLCIIGEPSGATRITLGYKGHLMIDYTLAVPVVHTSRPEPSAGARGVLFWQAVQDWCETFNQPAEREFDRIFPQLRAINTSSDGFLDTVTLTIGFRLPPSLTPDEVIAAAAELAHPEAELRGYSTATAYLGAKNNALVRGMSTAIRALGTGVRPRFVLKGGTSDMNIVGAVWDCPIIAYGPGDSSLDHTPNEHLPLNEYAQAVAALVHLIEHLPA